MQTKALLLLPWLLVSGLYENARHITLIDDVAKWKSLRKRSDPMLVEFFSPGCPHCQNFAEDYEKAAEYLKGVVSVYAIASPEITARENVSGVPAVKFYADKEVEEYKGPRTAKGVTDFCMSKVTSLVNRRMGKGPKSYSKEGSKRQGKEGSVVELTAADFDQRVMADTQNVWFVKFYAPWCGHCQKLMPTWEELAKQMEGKARIAKVDGTVETELAARFQVHGFPTLILFPAGKKSPQKAVKYQQGRELVDLTRFVVKYAEKSIRATQLLDQEQFDQECASKLCFVSFLPNIFDSSAKERKSYLKTLRNLAVSKADLPIKYFWIEAGNSLELERALRLEFGWPATIVVNKAKGFYTTHRGGFKEADLSSFVDRVTTGRVSGDALPPALPNLPKMEKWDGKDAPREEL